MNEQDYDVEEYEPDEPRRCSNSCPHYDDLNECCWQATGKGLCFSVSEDDYCHLGYTEEDDR